MSNSQRPRDRLAPFSFRQFVENTKAQEHNSERLSEEEVERRCLAVLGYMEEYYHPSSQTPPEMDLDNETDLISLNNYLDKLLNYSTDPASKPENKSEEDKGEEEIKRHRENIKRLIQSLLSHPQVLDKFKTELHMELKLYSSFREDLRKFRINERLMDKLNQAIFMLSLKSKKEHGRLYQTISDKIQQLQTELQKRKLANEEIENTATPEKLGYLRTQTLLEYKRQIQENKNFVLTPSRKELLERIKRGVLAGKKVFLVGSTGTGKSQLAFAASSDLTQGYELIPWHEGSTPRDVYGYPKISIDPATGQSFSHIEPGPATVAKEQGVVLIHSEITGALTRVLLSLKDTLFSDPSVMQIFTGNPKDERTKDRENLDPAILRELFGIEVGYMPSSELYDIVLAGLIEEDGVIRLGQSELKYIEKLCQAAELTQKIHNREFEDLPDEIKTLIEIDQRGNTDVTLNNNFLDPGTLFNLFKEWEGARARGESFEQYMQTALRSFIQDPKTLSAPNERKTLKKILYTFGLITSSSGEVGVSINKPDNEKNYTLPSEMARGILYREENPMGDVPLERETRLEQLRREYREREEKFWREKLKPAPGSVFEIPELPEWVPQELLERLRDESGGMALICLPKLDIGTKEELINMGVDNFLDRIEQRYPGIRNPEGLSEKELNDPSIAKLPGEDFWKDMLPLTPIEDLDPELNNTQYMLNFPDEYNTGGWSVMEIRAQDIIMEITFKELDELIKQYKVGILTELGLPNDLNVRLPTVAELSLMLCRTNDGGSMLECTCDLVDVYDIKASANPIDVQSVFFSKGYNVYYRAGDRSMGYGFRKIIPLEDEDIQV